MPKDLKRLAVVLMRFFAPKTYANLPAKLVFMVDDPAAFVQAIGDEGLTVFQTPASGVVGVAKDPDGYEIQIVQTLVS